MTIIREGIGIQNGMGLLCRNATDTLETFVGSVYRANLTLPTFFKPHLQHIPATGLNIFRKDLGDISCDNFNIFLFLKLFVLEK